LSCLLTLIRNDQYKVEVWKSLSMNDGVQTLFNLAKSRDSHISQLANVITNMLQLEEPAIRVAAYDIGSALKAMCNNAEFSDVRFVCRGGTVYGHKAILASRCQQFHAMFTHFREAKQSEIFLHDIDHETLLSLLEWIYTGNTCINRRNAVDVLVAAEMYGLSDLKEKCEFFLWHYIDLDNVIELYQTAALHQATQLARVCAEFIARNFSQLYVTKCYQSLSAEEKDEISNMIKTLTAHTDSSGMCVDPSSSSTSSTSISSIVYESDDDNTDNDDDDDDIVNMHDNNNVEGAVVA